MTDNSKTTRIDVEELRQLQARLKEINDLSIHEINWYENGKKIEVPEKFKDEWKFIGLSNVYFLQCFFGKLPPPDTQSLDTQGE